MFKFGFGDPEPPTPAAPSPARAAPPARPAVEIPYIPPPPLTSQTHDAVTLCNGALLLRKSTAVAPQSLTPSGADIVPSTYEGGFKLWECAPDLAAYLHHTAPTLPRGAAVLELGAGHALPALVALRASATAVDIHDYNDEVLRLVTMPNVAANVPEPRAPVRYFAGDWAALPPVLGRTYDLVLTADTVYAREQNAALAACVLRALAPHGRALVAGKTYYFGVGGGMRSFERELRLCADQLGVCVDVEVVREIRDGASNVREIMQIKRV